MSPRTQTTPRRSISSKVILSFVMVVLFQGLVSILAVTWILSRTTSSTLEEQLARTSSLVEKYINEAAKSLLLKAKLLSGQEKLVGLIRSGSSRDIQVELSLMLNPLGLDAAFVVNDSLEVLARTGNTDALDIAMKNGIVLGSVEGSGIMLTGSINKMQMWALNPVLNSQDQVGALYAGINLNRAFLTSMEETCNVKMLLSLRRSIMVNGHLSDPVFLEYSRRSYSNPEQAENGSIDNLVYRLTRFSQFKDLSAVYFVDTTLSRSLMFQYTLFSIVFLILVLFIGVIMAIGLYRMSFQKPFTRFQQAIRSISRGELSFRARTPGGDEFSELEREFETMTVNLKQLEVRLQISSRMAAVGEMVAGVAHQIRNPLGIMKVSVGILGEAFNAATDPEGKYRNLVAMISGEVDTLSVVIHRFLDFTRPLQVRRDKVLMPEFLHHTLEMADLDRWPGIRVEVDCPRDLEAWMDPSLIQQVLTNIIINAFEASSPGDTIRIHVWTASRQEDSHQVADQAVVHPKLHITVKDEGIGMSEEVRSQVFNPFFTTKNSGTGLGLSIAHRIVEGHGGRIDFMTNPEKGTTFQIVV